MSLKTFHIVFITLSVVLAIGSAIYAVLAVGGGAGFVWAAVALAAGAGLTYYGRQFLSKMKQLESAA